MKYIITFPVFFLVVGLVWVGLSPIAIPGIIIGLILALIARLVLTLKGKSHWE